MRRGGMHATSNPTCRARRGSVLVMTVMLIPVMLLGFALMTEFGNVGVGRSRAQGLADAAAKAGAYRVSKGGDEVELAVSEILADAGLSPGASSGTIALDSVTIARGTWDVISREFVEQDAATYEANAVRVELHVSIASLTGSVAGFDRSTHVVTATAMMPGVMLAVDDADHPKANDVYMMDYIRNAGFPVRLVDVYDVEPESLVEGDILFISSSVHSHQVDPRLFNVDAPVLVGETNLYDEFGMIDGDDSDMGHLYGTTAGTTSLDCELDLRDLNTDGDWRHDWQNWWDETGSRHNNGSLAQQVNDGTYDWGSRVKHAPVTSQDGGQTGWASRVELGSDAVVLNTMPGDPWKATTFWFDAGSTLGNGTVTQYKRAGVFTRTREFTGSNWSYTDDGLELMAQTIRWMLIDEVSRTRLVE